MIPAMRALAPGMAVMVCGCASITAVQTADTVGRGNLQWGIEMGLQGTTPRDGEQGSAWPRIDVGARYGVTERVDVSARFGQSVLELGVKALLTPVDHPRLAFSAGATAGGLVMLDNSTNTQFGALSAAIPLLLGVKLGAHQLVVGARAQYLGAMVLVPTHSLLVGGSLGFALRVSPNFIMMPEVGVTMPVLPRVPTNLPRFVRAYANGPLFQLTIGLLVGHTRTSHPEGDPHAAP